MAFFGLKLGLDLEMRAAHPHQKFQGVPPGVNSDKVLTGVHDRPAVRNEKMQRFYSLALTRMSCGDFPLRYDRRGGSLNIFLSCGWFLYHVPSPHEYFFLSS